MKAAGYERRGPAAEVLTVGETDAPEPGPGEVRVRLDNPGAIQPATARFCAGC